MALGSLGLSLATSVWDRSGTKGRSPTWLRPGPGAFWANFTPALALK